MAHQPGSDQGPRVRALQQTYSNISAQTGSPTVPDSAAGWTSWRGLGVEAPIAVLNNLYSLLHAKPYFSEFKALIDALGLSASARYPFAPKVHNPLYFNASESAPCTTFIPNNYAMAQAYSAMLSSVGMPPICANATSYTRVSCGYDLPPNATTWLAIRTDLQALVRTNAQYMVLLVAGHILRERRTFTLAALAPHADNFERVTAKVRCAHVNMYACKHACVQGSQQMGTSVGRA